MLHLLPLAALAAVAAAAPPSPPYWHSIPAYKNLSAPVDFDIIIIGGGPAGLSTLSGMARIRRTTLLIDSGEYRNLGTRHMHDVLGHDGVTPEYFRYESREDLKKYNTIHMINGSVLAVARYMPPEHDGAKKGAVIPTFAVHSYSEAHNGSTWYTTRKVVFATGLKDVLPSTPGIAENWGAGIFWCPWCDGHEHADQPLAVLGDLPNIPSMLGEVALLNRDIIALVNGTDTPKMRRRLEKQVERGQDGIELYEVPIDNRTLTEVVRLRNDTGGGDPSLPSVPHDDLFELQFETGDPLIRAAILAQFPTEQMSWLGRDLGVDITKDGRMFADFKNGLMTNIEGVYAVGDCNSNGVTNVPHAIFSGKKAAVHLHIILEREDRYRALQRKDQLAEEAAAAAAAGVVVADVAMTPAEPASVATFKPYAADEVASLQALGEKALQEALEKFELELQAFEQQLKSSTSQVLEASPTPILESTPLLSQEEAAAPAPALEKRQEECEDCDCAHFREIWDLMKGDEDDLLYPGEWNNDLWRQGRAAWPYGREKQKGSWGAASMERTPSRGRRPS